jgi:hypothetical protein
MSSLVVTSGATYEGINRENVNSLIVETDNDPELNPEIKCLIRPSTRYGYRPEDRNDLLRSVNIESQKKPFKYHPIRIPNYKNTDNYASDEDIDGVDGGFEGGDLLFKVDEWDEEFDDGFEGGAVGEYFSW